MGAFRNDVAAAKASVNVSLANLVNGILGAIFFIFYARALTVKELGILGALTLIYTVFQYLGQFGLNVSSISLISMALVDGRRSAARMISGFILLSVFFAVVSMVPAYVFASALSELTFKDASQTAAIQVCAIVVLANAIGFDFDGITEGVRDFARVAYSHVVGQIFRVVVSVILILGGYGVLAIIIGSIFGATGIVSMLIQLHAILENYKLELPNAQELQRILRPSLPLHGSNLLYLISMQIDLAILVGTRAITDVGIYSVVLTITGYAIFLVINPISDSLVSYMSKIVREKGQLEKAFAKGTRYTAFVCVPTAIVLSTLSKPIVLILAGPKYYAAILPLAIVILSIIPFGYTSLVRAVLQAQGKNMAIFAFSAAGTAAEAIVGLLLAPSFGPIGAAASRVALYVTSLAAGALLLRPLLRIKIDRLALGKCTLASLAYVIVPITNARWSHPITTALSFILATEIFLLLLKVSRMLDRKDIELLTGSVPMRLNFLTQTSFIKGLTDWLTA
jgi:O-antigen/teichoic acid export membrane protein